MGPGAVTVEVDLYSGRPNPRFMLQPSEISEFTSRMAALPTTDDPAPSVPLGYRGLRVETGQSGSMSEIGVFDGVVTVHEPAGTERLLSDRDRDLERWLIDLGADGLEQDEVSFVRSELGR